MVPRVNPGVWCAVVVLLCVSTTASAAYRAGDIVELPSSKQLYQNPHEGPVGGRWRILKVLGTGQVSAYLARPLGQDVTEDDETYEFMSNPEKDPEARVLKWVAPMQFLTGAQEVKIAKKFVSESSDEQSPYVVTVCGAFKTGMLQYVMVYKYGGKPLGKYYEFLRDNAEVRLEVMRKMMSALQYISTKRVLHRDVKPDNILLQVIELTGGGREYNPIFIDFGMGVDLDSSTYFLDDKKVGQSRMPLPEWSHTPYSMPVWSHDMFKLGVVFAEMSFGREIGSKVDPPLVVKTWEDLNNIWNDEWSKETGGDGTFGGGDSNQMVPDIDFLRRYMICEDPKDRATPLEVEKLLTDRVYRLMVRDLARSPTGREVELVENNVWFEKDLVTRMSKQNIDDSRKEEERDRAQLLYLNPRPYMAVRMKCSDLVPHWTFSVSGDVYNTFQECDVCASHGDEARRMGTMLWDEVQEIFPWWRIAMLSASGQENLNERVKRKEEAKEHQAEVLRLYFKVMEYIAKTESSPTRPCSLY